MLLLLSLLQCCYCCDNWGYIVSLVASDQLPKHGSAGVKAFCICTAIFIKGLCNMHRFLLM